MVNWGSMAAAGEVDASAILLIWLRKPYYLASIPMLSKSSLMAGHQ
jgi:hypothetical protein